MDISTFGITGVYYHRIPTTYYNRFDKLSPAA